MFKKKRNTIVTIARAEAQRAAEQEVARAGRTARAEELAELRKKRDERVLDQRMERIAEAAIDKAMRAAAVAARKASGSHNVGSGQITVERVSDGSKRVFYGREAVLDAGVSVLEVVGHISVDHLDRVPDEPKAVVTDCHCSSPVVAESEADTSDAPAMTVQEGGGSTAAPGVEGVSPAASTPRFVAVGEHVYDRDLHRIMTAPAPAYRARCLNDGSFGPELYTWEDAK